MIGSVKLKNRKSHKGCKIFLHKKTHISPKIVDPNQ